MHFKGDFLRGRSFGVTLLPPFPFGSPISRIYYGCYFLNCSIGDALQEKLQLNGDSGLGKFELIQLGNEDRYFIHPRNIIAFSFQGNGGLHTQIGRLFSPSCWGIHHPLPVIAHGPGSIIVYAENLYETELDPDDSEYIPDQIVAFDCSKPFTVKALLPKWDPISHTVNALIDDNRICFNTPVKLYVSPINRPMRRWRTLIHVLIHLAIVYCAVRLLRGF